MKTRSVINILKMVREEVYRELRIVELEIVLRVSENEGLTQVDLAADLDMLSGTLSRNIAKLSAKIIRKENGQYEDMGHGLLDVRTDPSEMRSTNIYLTDKGRELVDQIASRL